MNRIFNIYKTLLESFGPQHWWPGDSPWEIAVGAILTQQVSWTNVEKAINNLKSKGLLELEVMVNAKPEEIRECIKPTGFFNQKADRLISFARYVLHKHDSIEQMLEGETHQVREELLAQNGIGPETADSILLYAGNHPIFVVDAYTKRVARCIGLVGFDDYHKLQSIFTESLPNGYELYNEYHALIVKLGKENCKTKPICSNCPIREYASTTP
ncbi:MAG TPA: endonuclease III domain-containing protein [Caldisericia bacterium]|nr:endonuclease III domain-containing protein [Caldisericia bacterium]HPF48207.1 endonuclease III domain-containing protein [Caldisericia bacterium]HPI83857.1 endonuclease III domain-containing protein [Caldisericia bacterium]HPQ92660.1 endonuclease III domain-containing protein [Caldisericia bacterium]HRV74242.1 endonuclease III domain-containing protein [Caldisericia bacterium]